MSSHSPLCSPASLYGDGAEDEFCHCELVALVRKEIADDLRQQAETANFSVRGKHPKIQMETHAAALRWAAKRVESGSGHEEIRNAN